MALKFNGIEAVRFGSIVEVPIVNNELRVRIVEASKNQTNLTSLVELVASAFPENKDSVKKFIENQMSPYEFGVLLSYLAGGNEGVELARKSTLSKMSGN